MQLYMFERIGKDKIEDSPKKACARAGLLAEVDLPQVAPTCIFFVFCFVSFSSVFALIKSVALRSVVLRYA